MAERTNEYGLTYAEWRNAATMGGKFDEAAKQFESKLPDAWLDGEDPTEWARHFEQES